MPVIAHVSDLHVDGTPQAAERVARVLAYVAGLGDAVDAIVVTGDVTEHGTAEEYAEARALLDAVHVDAILPGNHDVRAAFRAGLLDADAVADPFDRVTEAGGVTFVAVDTTVPGVDEGWLDDGSLAWLERTLREQPEDTTVVLLLHHPPALLGIPFIDDLSLGNPDGLRAIVERHDNVVALLAGHAHTPAATTFAGRPLLVAPAVANTLVLPFEPAGVVDYRLPPAFALHVLGDDGRLTTHVRVVP